ncbi:MAG: hypothetical protein AAFQ66_19560 [Pseudomonadota bacterium]
MSDAEEGGKCPFGFDAKPDSGAKRYTFSHTAVVSAMPRNQLPSMASKAIKPQEDGLQTGRCLCGAVSYAIEKPAEKVFANYDQSTLRWTGGVGLTIVLRASSTRFHGWGNVVQHASSDRARHCFCRLCGSSLFIRHVAPEAMDGMLSLSAGTLDSLDGLHLGAETYIDRKPDLLMAGDDHRKLTEAEVEAMYAPRMAGE